MAKDKNGETKKKDCKHWGSYSDVAQSLVVNPQQILIITSVSCKRCGHVMTNIKPFNLGQNSLAIPKTKMPNIDK